MPAHYTFHLELEKLNKKILEANALVESRVRRARDIITTQDQSEIQDLIRTDYEVDEMEVEIEED